VRDGMADLRAAPRGPSQPVPENREPEALATPAGIGGLLGVLRGPGQILILGSLVAHARALADSLDGIEILAADAFNLGGTEEEGVSRILVRSTLPLLERSLRGVAIVERVGVCDLAEATRVVGPGGRLAVFGAEPGTGERIRGHGLEILAEESDRVVAYR
jgi:hypothetical protein